MTKDVNLIHVSVVRHNWAEESNETNL